MKLVGLYDIEISEWSITLQWQMQDFLKGCSILTCESAHKIFRPRPHFVETTPIFEREASYSTCQSIRFRSRSLLRHAEVSHRSRFLSSSHRKGVPFSLSPVLLCTRSSPKGGFICTPLKSTTGLQYLLQLYSKCTYALLLLTTIALSIYHVRFWVSSFSQV